MKYCPSCEAEYEDGIEECSDCLVRLVPEHEYRQQKEQEERVRKDLSQADFVPVKVAGNRFEADRVRGVLEQEGIPVMVRNFLDTAYDGIYVSQKGWGYVEVPCAERERAERIVQEFSSAFATGEEPKDVARCACGHEIGSEDTVCPGCGAPVEE